MVNKVPLSNPPNKEWIWEAQIETELACSHRDAMVSFVGLSGLNNFVTPSWYKIFLMLIKPMIIRA
jgi:hypothetical protein